MKNFGKPTKAFKVISVSKNANSFGLYGHILLAEDGTAFEVARSTGAWNEPWPKGKDLTLILDQQGNPLWEDAMGRSIGVELPRQLPSAPLPVVKEVFGELKH